MVEMAGGRGYSPSSATLVFRPKGSPAGSHPHTPWWQCVFHDPYERINFWSHLVPGIALLVLGYAAHVGAVDGGTPLWIFCLCGATTHLLSALTHVWPDDHILEKADHVGIVALVLGTPVTCAMAQHPHENLSPLALFAVVLFIGAFLPPKARTLTFMTSALIAILAYRYIVNANLLVQVALYTCGAIGFLRNAGHDRWSFLADHHFLHYFVSVACVVQIVYLRTAVQEQSRRQHTD